MKSKFDWRAAYFHLVSLVGIIVILIAAIQGGHGLMRILFPKLAINEYEWQKVSTLEQYKRSNPRPAAPAVGEDQTAQQPDKSDAQWRQEWEEYRQTAVEGQKRRGLWNLLESLMTLIVAIPIFWWHRRAARRLKPADQAET
ncbi:MAG TPA: hypothetical protein VGB22_08925 [candidate division Zixibacteria bacterium]|jgi:hypothetical protein